MTHFLNESDFDAAVQNHRTGKHRLVVSKQVARQFFLRMDNESVKAIADKHIWMHKTIIWLMNVGAPVVFIVCMASIYQSSGTWEAGLIIPVAGICWTVIYGLTSDQGGWLIGTVPLALCFVWMGSGHAYGEPAFWFVLSIWLQRTSYLLSGYWLTNILLGSYAAFEMLEAHVSFED